MPIIIEHGTHDVLVQHNENTLSIHGIELLDGEVILQMRQRIPMPLPENAKEIEAVELLATGEIRLKLRYEIEITEGEVWRRRYPEEFEDLDDDAIMKKVPQVIEAIEVRGKYGDLVPNNVILSEAVLRWRDQYLEDQDRLQMIANAEAITKAEKMSRLEKLADIIASSNLSDQELAERLK